MTSQLQEMKPEHTQAVAQLLARNFNSNNPIWHSFQLDPQAILGHFTQEVKAHLESQERVRKQYNPNVTLNVYLHEGNVVAAGTNLELYEYLNMSEDPSQSETLKQFEFLESQGKKLFEAVNLQDYEKGRHLYGSWICIDQKVSPEVKKTFRNQSLIATYKEFIQQGFKSILLRASSPKSAHIYASMGAKVLSECEVTIKEERCELKLMKLELDNPVFQKMIGL